MSWLRRLYRGRPIVVVSGLPRSGTSMAMKMLDAGGMPIVTDGVRSADISNPNGYYEFEPVKDLQRGDAAWLGDARGKAVKIVSPLLTYLPESFDYQVIFMRRPLAEIVASQHAMLDARGSERGSDESRSAELYAGHLAQVERFLQRRRCFSTVMIEYAQVLADPRGQAERIQAFLGRPLDTARMAAVADPALHRNRRA
jgi:hypothetical protein